LLSGLGDRHSPSDMSPGSLPLDVHESLLALGRTAEQKLLEYLRQVSYYRWTSLSLQMWRA